MANEPGTTSSDGLTIHYQVTGAGPPLILVHGWGADCQSNWYDSGWVDTLQSIRTVICLDVRGHGRSDKPHASTPYSYAAMSNDVIAVMDALDIKRADYMGYSMGAFMGAWLLGHRTDRLHRVVLGGIGDETPESAAQGAHIAAALRSTNESQHAYADAVRAFVMANPRNDLVALAYSAAQMWPEGYPRRLVGQPQHPVTNPILIVNGALDEPYTHTGQQLADTFMNGQYVTIPGHDHLSVVADPQFKETVVSFLDQNSP